MRGVTLLAIGFPLLATDALYLSTQQKFDQIEEGKLKPGSVVTFSPAELNAWTSEKAKESFPQGLRNPVIELGQGEVGGTALVDFLKLRQGQETNWLIAKLIEGERPLKIGVRITSGGGRA